MSRRLCFVLMPFGKKLDAFGVKADFDAVYRDLVAPAIEEAGLEPLRADEEMADGIIHKSLFERLILSEFAVADLTTADAYVFYELGIRHAVRPSGSVLLFAEGGRLPFDITPLRAMPYRLTPDGSPADVTNVKGALVKRLLEASNRSYIDSPIFQLVEGFPEIDHTRTDVFRDRVHYSMEIKDRLSVARKKGVEALRSVESEISSVKDQEGGIVIDLFLSYRAVKAWDDMVALVDKMSRPLAATVMVQEQLALALNRTGDGERAERVLKDLLDSRGPSSETYGILGRVYKDRWEAAASHGDGLLARGLLDKAIEAYLRGFEADWRDAYTGVNAVTLMELREPPDPRRADLIPVVSYAVERRIAAGKPDYWDYATRLELAVLAGDEKKARKALSDALASAREVWEPEVTARNLRLIREARERRQGLASWMSDIESAMSHPTVS